MAFRRYPKKRGKDHPRFPLKDAFEDAINDQIEQHEKPVYEQYRLPYTLDCNYTPDFLLSNGILIEVKGYFEPEDRTKLLQVKKQHPALDLRIVFQNARQKLSKTSTTTVADWCDKYGFPWAEKRIPDEWFRERKPAEEQAAILQCLQKRGASKRQT